MKKKKINATLLNEIFKLFLLYFMINLSKSFSKLTKFIFTIHF